MVSAVHSPVMHVASRRPHRAVMGHAYLSTTEAPVLERAFGRHPHGSFQLSGYRGHFFPTTGTCSIIPTSRTRVFHVFQVSKLYYNLTHQGIIWKNFLKRIGSNAPQRPPSHRHSPRYLTSFEAERLVTRSISLQKNWLSPNPCPLSRDSFQVHRLIQSMAVLPGGKYMVASVCNMAKTHYSIIVFALDHRIGGIVPLAETPVKQKAYNLKARYMNIDGTPSIVIAYIRRKMSSRYNNSG